MQVAQKGSAGEHVLRDGEWCVAWGNDRVVFARHERLARKFIGSEDPNMAWVVSKEASLARNAGQVLWKLSRFYKGRLMSTVYLCIKGSYIGLGTSPEGSFARLESNIDVGDERSVFGEADLLCRVCLNLVSPPAMSDMLSFPLRYRPA